MKNFCPLFFCLMFLVGCVSGGNQAITDRENLARIQEGKSNKAEVRTAVGQPSKITPLPEGELWEYSYVKSTVNPAVMVPLVGLGVLASGYGTFNESYQLSVLFDNQGIVRKIQAGKANPKIYQAPFYGRVDPGEQETLRATPDAPRQTPVPAGAKQIEAPTNFAPIESGASPK